jgi:hypothetical protein
MLTNMQQGLVNAGNNIINLLPLCPFYRMQEITINSQMLSWLSWFIPFDAIIALLQAWLSAITVWYIAKTALRWAKVIS